MIEAVTGHNEAGRCQSPDHRVLVRCFFVFALLIVTGCGNQGPQRVAVQGTVQFDGKPVPDGSIRFIPLEGTPGPETAAPIVDGKYVLEEDSGPPVGKLRVEIRQGATIPPDLTNDHTALPKKYHLPQNSIPPQFNDKSSLSVETVVGSMNTFDFNLKPAK